MVYKIGICDDSEADREALRRLVQQWGECRSHTVQIREFSSAESFLFRYAEERDFDLLLLDIEMGAMDGVSLARKLRRDNESVQILFITGYDDYLSQGYEVSAVHYLMKPVPQEALFAALDRGARALGKQERAVILSVDGEQTRVPVSEIEYVESFSHWVEIVTARGRFQVKQTIRQTEQELGSGFVRCHRSYLAGLRHIARLSKTEVILDSGKALPLSRSAAAQTHRAFISYYTGDADESI